VGYFILSHPVVGRQITTVIVEFIGVRHRERSLLSTIYLLGSVAGTGGGLAQC